MRAEQRAEIPVPHDAGVNRTVIIPRELRTPIVGARLLLTGLAAGLAGTVAQDAFKMFTGSGSSIAEAATSVCDPRKNNYEYTIVLRRAPHYDLGGKVGSFDKGVDPWFEIPVLGGGVKAVDSATGEVLNQNNYVLQKPNVSSSLFQPKEGEQNVAWSVLRWKGKCDADTSRNTPSGKSRVIPGKKIKIVTTQDEANQTFDWIAAASGVDSVWTGRAYKTVRHFLEDYEKFSRQARDLTPETLEKLRASLKKTREEEERRLSPTAVPTAIVTGTPNATGPLATAQAEATKAANAFGTAVTEARGTVAPAPIRTPIAAFPTSELSSQVAVLVATQVAQSQATFEARVATQAANLEATVVAVSTQVAKIPTPKPPGETTESGSIPVVSGLWEGIKFIGDLPALGADQLPVISNTQFPVRTLMNVLGWLLIVTPQRIPILGYLGKPRTYFWRSVRFPFRYPKALLDHRAAVRAAVAAGNPAPPFVRPHWV